MSETTDRDWTWTGLNSVGTGHGIRTAESSDGTRYIGGAKDYMMHGDGQMAWVEQFNLVRKSGGCGAFEGWHLTKQKG
jgi:hypothetical protein